MNGTTAANADMAALRQEYDRLRQQTDLASATGEAWELSREVGRFEERIEALGRRGYAFTRRLAREAADLRERWRTAESNFDRILRDARYDVRRDLDRVDRALRDAERAPGDGTIGLARTEIRALARRLDEERSRLIRTYENEKTDIRAFDRHLDALEWSTEQLSAAAFQLDAGETMIVAAQVEWREDGDGDERDGVLYLTDRRLLLERKERTGAFLGIFGGRMEQALVWSLALDDVEDVRSEDMGILGSRDMLSLRARRGGEAATELSIEIKANADNQEWAGFITRAKAHGYEDERL